MKATVLSTLFAVLVLVMPSHGYADSITLDYNEKSYSSNITGTFVLPTDVGLVTSADFSIYVAGHRTFSNSRYTWWYGNSTDLILGSRQMWDNKELSGDFSLFTFSLDQASLIELNANREISFGITGESTEYDRDDGGWGYTTSRNYLDWAQLDVASAATPIPGAVWLLGTGLAGLVGIRRKMKA